MGFWSLGVYDDVYTIRQKFAWEELPLCCSFTWIHMRVCILGLLIKSFSITIRERTWVCMANNFFSNSSTISSPQCKLLFSLSELFSCYLLFVMSCVRLYSMFVSVYCTTLLSSLYNSYGTVMSNLWVTLRFSQDLLTSMEKAMDTLPCSHGNGWS